ncbi:TetR/AcrR family transcriptional regulator [Actinomadura rugatobispora]|uniref:TetR/AcrR family transcriptional regulator n=1 Tax=Actinomadura rugatobispora TaxID=1994 RepID=A0ABW1A0D2_9ACTN|nr:hypothetical protein GCM10010200_107660 [Actinomadura rugatobispora]
MAERPSPRELRRRLRIELSREQLLDTAEELFTRRGYHETSLKDVAERSEYSVASIYSFFESKEDLYLAVLMRRGAEQRAEMGRLAAEEAAAGDRLVAMVRAQVECRRRYPAWGRLHAQATKAGGAGAGDVPQAYRDYYQEIVGLLAAVVAEGQDEGAIRSGDPHALSRLCCALVDGFTLMDPMVSDEPAGLDAEEFLRFVRETFTTA